MKGIKSLAVTFATAFLLAFTLAPLIGGGEKVLGVTGNYISVSTYDELMFYLGPANYSRLDDELYLVLDSDIKTTDGKANNYFVLDDDKEHTIHLDLAGHNLTRYVTSSYDTCMFDVAENATLYIEDSVGGGTIKAGFCSLDDLSIFKVSDNGQLIINGGSFNVENLELDTQVIRCDGGKTTINAGDFYGYHDLVHLDHGRVNIYGGTFRCYTMASDHGNRGMYFDSTYGNFTIGNCTMQSACPSNVEQRKFYITVAGNGMSSSQSLGDHLLYNTKVRVDEINKTKSQLDTSVSGMMIEFYNNYGIEKIQTVIAEPHHGNTPATLRSYTTATYITSREWYHGDTPMEDDEKFEAGETYTLKFTVGCENTDYFKDPKVTVNYSDANVTVTEWSSDIVKCTYTVVPDNRVNSVSVSVNDPETGTTPDLNAKTTTPNVNINSVTWTDENGNSLKADSNFESCKKYTATFALNYKNTGSSDDPKYYITSNTTVDVNGSPAEFVGYKGSNTLFSYTFAPSHNIEYMAPLAPTCTEDGNYECWHCTECGKYFLKGGTYEVDSKTVIIPALGHSWGKTEYTWAKDGSSCVASRTCTRDSSHIESENAIISSEVKTPATLTSMGTTLYTAKFKYPGFETQTFEVQDIPVLTPTPKPTATPTATPTPKATATPKVTATPVPTVAKPTATSAVTATPTATPVVTSKPTDVATPTDVPAVTPEVTPTTTPSEDPKVQILAFVERIYIYVLDREPETEGAAYWSDELYAFRRTGAEVAQGFIFSQEFIDRNTTDEQFVTILYKTFFGRDADEAGMNYWLGQLSSGTMDRTTVANGFIYSQEWADTCASYGIRSGGELKPTGKIKPTELTYAFVERMYTTAMGRGYDEEGRQYWASELANFNITGEQVGASFFLSAEMEGYKLSDQEFLNRLYATFMNREADADGSAYWLGVMASGTPRADIVYGFTRSPEFTEKCVEARILPF